MADTITIPAIELKRISVTIEGMTPLIVHRFGEKAREAIEDKQQKKAKQGKAARNPEEEFRDALYVIEEGRYGFPAAGVKKALVTAGGRFTDAYQTHLKGAVQIVGDLLEITGSEPTMRSDPVRLARNTTSIAYRPQFVEWSIEVPVVFNANVISEEQVVNLFQIAGFSTGIGDWRPEKNGTFGQFNIGEVSR